MWECWLARAATASVAAGLVLIWPVLTLSAVHAVIRLRLRESSIWMRHPEMVPDGEIFPININVRSSEHRSAHRFLNRLFQTHAWDGTGILVASNGKVVCIFVMLGSRELVQLTFSPVDAHVEWVGRRPQWLNGASSYVRITSQRIHYYVTQDRGVTTLRSRSTTWRMYQALREVLPTGRIAAGG